MRTRLDLSSLLAGALAVVLIAGGAVVAETDFPVDEDGFQQIRVAPGVATGERLIDVVMPFLAGHPESLEGNAGLTFTVTKGDGGFHVEIIATGYADDSVGGEHFRGFVIPTEQGWELIEMAVKPECRRGEPVDGRCP